MFQRALSNSGGGGGGTLAPELIWVNPSPTSAFSAQTITENTSGWVSGKRLADYDGIIILGQYDSSHYGKMFTYFPKNVPTFASDFNYRFFFPANSTGNTAQGRPMTLSDAGIDVGSRELGIPLYIWGVKGVLSNS